ncbi:radical SAM protein [Methanocalculus taiwanensis]|uniref:Radical SAM protein n=1 Tax=Methanocalculus taiwanensis TaxID=106207 RepID=A0ABD4TJZ2_9EURY|nr:radical SAM protein [Methanocalculus taiwanensis]MCQ1539248.1 radical SAM protein [Methanocalculus taiwanensis]
MRWHELKAELLAIGSCRLTGADASGYIESSAAGPGAGGEGSVFFSMDGKRIRLSISPDSPVEIRHDGDGHVHLSFGKIDATGILEQPALHCPRQAYITVSGNCIFSCKYCPVPLNKGRVKTPDEIVGMIESVINRIDSISITSGVIGSIEDDEKRVINVLERIKGLDIPVGVSIYPGPETPDRLYSEGVSEVKFNLETATSALFEEMCPGLSWDAIIMSLDRSVALFGRGNVFSNVILGLGETDEEMEACIRLLTGRGVIPVIRPLTPAAAVASYKRPSPERLLRIAAIHWDALKNAGLDTGEARTMCTYCTGCDIVPGRDCE